ncbi:MAG: PQQ-like beta-propeller repeat protein [Pirellula sp.]|jgi:outer membrane protein assembly factor BamB|nr:PQQ-like beta-propeller repeat protein [Pirellula sp.]
MKAIFLSLAMFLIASFPQFGLSQQTGEPRNFFAADYEKKIAALVNADGSVRWSLPIQAIHDAQELENGHWLLQTSFGEVNEVDAQGKIVWTYKPNKLDGAKGVEIHAFQKLASGELMIAESGNKRILFLDQQKRIASQFPLTVKESDPHRDTRLVRQTPQDTFLVCHEAELTIREYKRDGSVIWEYPIGTKVYSATRLENGNTLIGTGSGNKVVEVSPDKKVVWEVNKNDLPGVELAWITMVERLPSGNTWIVNCHAGAKNPQIIEVNAKKEIVWSFKDFERFGNSLPVAVPASK